MHHQMIQPIPEADQDRSRRPVGRADVFSGNVSDWTWSLDAVQKMKQFFITKGENIPFVLHSSLVPKPNLAGMEQQGIRFFPSYQTLSNETSQRS
jgi:hypothetical protein